MSETVGGSRRRRREQGEQSATIYSHTLTSAPTRLHPVLTHLIMFNATHVKCDTKLSVIICKGWTQI